MASSSPKSMLQEVLTTFESRLHSKVPLKLDNPTDFRDEAKIRAVAKGEKQTAWKEFTKKLFNLDDPETDEDLNAVTKIMKEFVHERKKTIDDLIAKHKTFKKTAETLVSKDIEERYKKLKKSVEDSLEKDPRMDVKVFIQNEKVSVVDSFQKKWSGGNADFFKEQKGKLMKKLEELEKEMEGKQRSGNDGIILEDGMTISMAVDPGAVEMAKVEHENGDEGSEMDDHEDEDQSVSMVVNTSASFNRRSDEVIGLESGSSENGVPKRGRGRPPKPKAAAVPVEGGRGRGCGRGLTSKKLKPSLSGEEGTGKGKGKPGKRIEKAKKATSGKSAPAKSLETKMKGPPPAKKAAKKSAPIKKKVARRMKPGTVALRSID